MPLILDDRKLLPLGVHEASMQEVEEQFARFQKSDRRIRLFQKLSDYVTAVKKAECGTSVIIDGSFIMACVDEPSDIDLILILPANWDATADLKPYQYSLVSKQRVRKAYKIDVVAVHPGSTREHDWTGFFSRVNVKWCEQFGWPNRSTKGLVKVTL